MSTNYENFMKQYKIDHEVCPTCKKSKYSTTLMCYIFNSDNPTEYKDKNRVTCLCGWKGIVHDLIKK